MADSKYWTLVRRLNAETKRGRIVWERTSQDGAYQAAFPGYTIVLTELDAPSMKYMRILNADGDVVEVVSDEEIDEGSRDHAAYKLMTETYKSARRQAMGIDTALDAILGTLGEADDEIPF
jgi:hypothetical protein